MFCPVFAELLVTSSRRIVPISAHAAFDKGATYMGIKVHTIPVDPETRQVDIKRVARAINGNTIMVRKCRADHEACSPGAIIARWLCSQLPRWVPG